MIIYKSVNLFITNLCNRRCPYCDVKDWITHDPKTTRHMSLKDLDKVIDWLKRSHFYIVQLVGGEPMLHPNIAEIVRKFVSSGIQIRSILTNGLGSTRLYEEVAEIITPNWLVNVNNPKTYSADEWELLKRNLDLLRWKDEDRLIGVKGFDYRSVALQFAITFYQPDQEYAYIIDMAKKYNCGLIRYDVSHPCSNMSNIYIDLEGLSKVKPVLMRFLRDCVRQEIRPHLDCVLPSCVFTIEELKYLLLHAGVKSHCQPCFDLMPDLKIEYCTSMRGVVPAVSIDAMGLLEIEKNQRINSDALRLYPAHMQCKSCPEFASRQCQGYCLRLKAGKRDRTDPRKGFSILG